MIVLSHSGRSTGFTLVELAVVLIIVIILLTVCAVLKNGIFLENKMNQYLCFAFILILGGCALPGTNSSIATSSGENFQLHTGPDGRVYRISSRTGKTSWLDGSTYREVNEQGMPQLVVDKVYRGEIDGDTYKYQGGGKLEKWGLDRYMIKPSSDVSKQK